MSPRQFRILAALGGAVVVVLAIIAVVLVVRDGDESAAPPPTTLPPATTVAASTTAPPTTAAPTTAAPTTTITTTTTATSTTSTTTTTMATTTTATECAFVDDLQGPLANFLFLDPAGLGLVSFGDDPEVVTLILSCLLGPPDSDSGWQGSFSVFGTCPGTEVRGVTWGPLTVLFGDAASDYAAGGTRHFLNWRYDAFNVTDDLGLVFPDTQIGLGSTSADLQAAYGADVEMFAAEDIFPAAFFVGDDIFGTLDADPPAGRVVYIEAGVTCGE